MKWNEKDPRDMVFEANRDHAYILICDYRHSYTASVYVGCESWSISSKEGKSYNANETWPSTTVWQYHPFLDKYGEYYI